MNESQENQRIPCPENQSLKEIATRLDLQHPPTPEMQKAAAKALENEINHRSKWAEECCKLRGRIKELESKLMDKALRDDEVFAAVELRQRLYVENAELKADVELLNKTIAEMFCLLPESYSEELRNADWWIEWCRVQNDLYGKNFHQGRKSGMIFGYLRSEDEISTLRKELKLANERLANHQRAFIGHVYVPSIEYEALCRAAKNPIVVIDLTNQIEALQKELAKKTEQ